MNCKEEATAGVSAGSGRHGSQSVSASTGAPALQFSLRPACLADVPALLAMIRELATFEKMEKDLQVTQASLRACLFGPKRVAYALMAISANQAVGYAVYFRTFSTFVGRPGIFLDDLYVRPDFRRRGVAKALLQEVARIGVENNAGRFEWIALNWNKNALALYVRLGMRILGDWVLLRTDSAGMRRIGEGNER